MDLPFFEYPSIPSSSVGHACRVLVTYSNILAFGVDREGDNFF